MERTGESLLKRRLNVEHPLLLYKSLEKRDHFVCTYNIMYVNISIIKDGCYAGIMRKQFPRRCWFQNKKKVGNSLTLYNLCRIIIIIFSIIRHTLIINFKINLINSRTRNLFYMKCINFISF